MLDVITDRATPQQLREMLEVLQDYIKLAVDVRRRILAGGGGLHADCEAALLEIGSQPDDIWGADWVPEGEEVRYESFINIRPKRGNRSMVIQNPVLRAEVEAIVRERFGV